MKVVLLTLLGLAGSACRKRGLVTRIPIPYRLVARRWQL